MLYRIKNKDFFTLTDRSKNIKFIVELSKCYCKNKRERKNIFKWADFFASHENQK
jgi:hypothetical protein